MYVGYSFKTSINHQYFQAVNIFLKPYHYLLFSKAVNDYPNRDLHCYVGILGDRDQKLQKKFKRTKKTDNRIEDFYHLIISFTYAIRLLRPL